MVWTDKDDDELESCHQKVKDKIEELKQTLSPAEGLLKNIQMIQTIPALLSSSDQKIIVPKKIPKDLWGNDMTNERRLKIKDECIKRTKKLVG